MPQTALAEGENTIDSAKGQYWEDGTVAISWSVLVPGEARARKRTTRGKRGTTVKELKRRAHGQAEKMVAQADGERRWTARSSMADYVRKGVVRAIEAEPELRWRTRKSYMRLAGILEEEAGRKTVGSFCRARALKEMLRHVAATHGTATAKQVRKFMGKYVMTPLVEDEAIPANPLVGLSVTLPQHKASNRPVGGKAIAPEDRRRCIEWLEAVDCEATASTGGRVTHEEAVRRRSELVNMTLLQATCGLRIGEVLALRKEDVYRKDGVLVVRVRPEVSKTHKGREVPVVDTIGNGEVAAMMEARASRARAGWPIFGMPTDPSRQWNESNCMKGLRYIPPKLTKRQQAAKREKMGPRADGGERKIPERRLGLYHEMAKALKLPILEEEATHVWRATLATERKAEGMPADMVSALFGHSEEVDEQYYTDAFRPSQILKAMGATTDGMGRG